MTLSPSLVAWHDRVGRAIDAAFPPRIASGDPDSGFWDAMWQDRAATLARTGEPPELAQAGKRWLYQRLEEALAGAAGGSLAGWAMGEVGAGSGLGALLSGGSARAIVLIDRSAAALDYSRRIAHGLGQDGCVEFIRADLLRDGGPPLPDGGLDLVFSSGLIEHFSSAEAVELLRRQRKMVRPGGVVVAFVPRLLSPCMLWRMQAARSKGNERFMTQRLLRALFDAAGLPGSKPCRYPSPLPASAPVWLMDLLAAATRPFAWVDMMFGRHARVE